MALYYVGQMSLIGIQGCYNNDFNLKLKKKVNKADTCAKWPQKTLTCERSNKLHMLNTNPPRYK